MRTGRWSIGLCGGLFIATGIAFLAGPAWAGGIKVSAEQEIPGDNSVQLKIDKVVCRDRPGPLGNPIPCTEGPNPATGTVECELPPAKALRRDITCVSIAAGTSVFYSGARGCADTAEAQWDFGINPGTQRVLALGNAADPNSKTVCKEVGVRPLPFSFGPGDTIRSEIKQ